MFTPYLIIGALADDARPVAVAMDADTLRAYLNAIEFTENVYGPESSAVHATMQKHLGDDVRAWFLLRAGTDDALHLANDESAPLNVRAFAAAIALGRPLPGSHGAADDSPRGGTPARVRAPKPRRPPGGNAVNPLAAMMTGAA